jgi:hypothetical protein
MIGRFTDYAEISRYDVSVCLRDGYDIFAVRSDNIVIVYFKK